MRQAHHERLGFGIAEAAIEFQDFWSAGGNHNPGVEATLVFDSLAEHAIDDGDEDVAFDLGEKLGGNDGGGGIGAHAAGHRAGVAIVHRLVVLGGLQHIDRAFLHQRQDGTFGTGEQFLDDDAFAGIAKALAAHHGVDHFQSIGSAVTKGDSLAFGQAGGLDDDRLTPNPHEFLGGDGIGEAVGLGGGNGLMAHDLLGEPFIGFDLGRGLAGAKYKDALFAKAIGQSHGQRYLRADDDQIDGIGADEFLNCGQIGGGDGNEVGQFRDAGIARSAKEIGDACGARQLPRQRMLASTAANNQYRHCRVPEQSQKQRRGVSYQG